MAAYDDMIASRPVVDEQTKIAGAKKAKDAAKAQASPSGFESFKAAEQAAAAPTTSGSGSSGGTTGGGSNPKTWIATDGKEFTSEDAYATYQASLNNSASSNYAVNAQAKLDAANTQADRVSAFNVLKTEFDKYGLGSLVDNVKGLLTDGTPPSEFALKLRETPAYQQRFIANADRIKAGLSALSPAEYVALEDQYQNIMRNYGLPESYYAQSTDAATGVKRQAGFDKLLAGDVSAAELENRVATAQQRVLNSNPEVLKALKQFYPDLNNADILAYTLDPKNGLDAINRKVTAAEIGGAALQQGLQAQGGTAESLAGQGITKAQAQQGYANVAEMLPRGSQLADIYGQGPYTQATAEAEVFNTAGAADAAAKRRKLTSLETANFSGSSGVGALGRDRQNPYGTTQSGYGSY